MLQVASNLIRQEVLIIPANAYKIIEIMFDISNFKILE
jgi:hypothetical protein